MTWGGIATARRDFFVFSGRISKPPPLTSTSCWLTVVVRCSRVDIAAAEPSQLPCPQPAVRRHEHQGPIPLADLGLDRCHLVMVEEPHLLHDGLRRVYPIQWVAADAARLRRD
jgi:hypothetical protein